MDEYKLRNLILEDALDTHTNLIGDLLYGTKDFGIRKIRLSKGKSKGKREGYRLIAYVMAIRNKAYILHIYDKKKKARLTSADRENLKKNTEVIWKSIQGDETMSVQHEKDFWKQFEEEGTIIEVDIPEFDELIDKSFVKTLRNDLDLTQKVFGNVLGVTKKTIEKWEQGANPVKGPAARLLYLLDDEHELVNRIYGVRIIETMEMTGNESYSFKRITPLVIEKNNRTYKVSGARFEERVFENQFVVEGGNACQKISDFRLLTS